MGCNDIGSEAFNSLLRALRDSPLESLSCSDCGIETIEIEFPRKLEYLNLSENKIDAEGCREIVNLLNREDSSLKKLDLAKNDIDDVGAAALADALRNNSTLEELNLNLNHGISRVGRIMLLEMLIDISSIKATLQSNHTLQGLFVMNFLCEEEDIPVLIKLATEINGDNIGNPEAAGRMKLINSQLDVSLRCVLAEMQEFSRPLCSQINPIYVPEVLELIGSNRGELGSMHFALKSSLAGMISIVNRKKYIKEQLAHYERKPKS